MNESFLPWILMIEIILPFIVLAMILLVVLVRSKSRLKESMRELIINVKDNEAVNKESVQRFLHEKLGFAESEVDKLSAEIIKERKFFFRTFVSSILNKDIENLALLDEELSRITERYHGLAVSNTSAAAESPVEESTMSDSLLQSDLEAKLAEIEELKEKNKSLKQEVHVTLTTLNNIFAEYSSMFGEEVVKKDMSVEQILTAMESFSGSKSEESFDKPEPLEANEQEDTDTVDDLELNEEEEKEEKTRSPLDDMELEDVASSDGEDPSWEDAFAESGDEMEKDPD